MSADTRERLYADLAEHSLSPLWTALHDLVPTEPATAVRPALWRYADLRPLLMRAGAAITAAEAIRRVLVLENPGLPGRASVTSTLYAGFQLILPGEIAPVHRHTQAAFRFVVEGRGAFTAVRGEKFPMRPGDLILTPNFEWHDHGHDGAEPVVWLDGLDIPLIRSLDAGFAETSADIRQALSTAEGHNAATWGKGLRPLQAVPDAAARVRRFFYPVDEWRPALETIAASGAVDSNGLHTLEFVNPVDGGPVLPTMSAFAHLLNAGSRSRPGRRSDGAVFHVVEGECMVRVGAWSQAVSPRDTFVVPPWQPYQFEAQSDLVLFSYSDRAVQQALGLWRESPAAP